MEFALWIVAGWLALSVVIALSLAHALRGHRRVQAMLPMPVCARGELIPVPVRAEVRPRGRG